MNKHYLIASLLLITGCEKTKPEPTPPACVASYTNDIKPIINTKCAIPDCHGNNGLANLADYTVLKTMADNVKVRKYVFELKLMPPSAKTQLTDTEKEKLSCWLDNGAPQN